MGSVEARTVMAIEVGARSDRGRRRGRNEDRVLVHEDNDSSPDGRSNYLLAVADGMGGAPEGDLASEVATDTIQRYWGETQGETALRLRRIFHEANEAVYRLTASNRRLRGMGTTLVAALVSTDAVWVANIGDSRAYLVRDGTLSQLTRDHSWVAEQVLAGRMSPQEAKVSPRRNLITRSIGIAKEAEVDVFEIAPLEQGDILLLCSDGLYTMVEGQDICDTLTRHEAQSAADALVALANARGGSDNIAVVVARPQRSTN